MKEFFADLHIHIGRTKSGKPVKITGSKALTIENILYDAEQQKGMDMVGVIDCHVPEVLTQLEEMVNTGELIEEAEGGLRYGSLTLILGTEIEINDVSTQGPLHVLCYMPNLDTMHAFSTWYGKRVKNLHLSTQRIYERPKVLQEKVRELGGLFIPAHVFTPFKSLYGSGVNKSLSEVFEPKLIDAIELGLSSNTQMADSLTELHRYTFVSNSDAHSTAKIGREYQLLRMEKATFHELKMALHNERERAVVKNFGLDPRLGKYHQTACENCGTPAQRDDACHNCGHHRFVKGVSNRIAELAQHTKNPSPRPPYIHQVPLEFIPKLGPKTLQKLRKHFGTEMNVLHRTTYEELKKVVSENIAKQIVRAREGRLAFQAGGAGRYGKVSSDS
ncbi:endonuclease Q family protein [Bacillus tianshenii]|nr:endonuclease Q family protein [Bacillus tianshenii]